MLGATKFDGYVNTDDNPYISITYVRDNPQNATGLDMVFLTYDLATKQLREECNIPYDSKYASGVVSLHNNTVYYSQRSDSADPSSPDNLCAYDMSSRQSTVLENENFSYNDIALIGKDKLLVVALTNSHIITPAVFDISSGTFSYSADVNEEPLDLYTSGPQDINYNYRFNRFLQVYYNVEAESSEGYHSFEDAIDNYIAVVSDDLQKKPSEIFSALFTAAQEIEWVTQLTEQEFLVQVRVTDIEAEVGFPTWHDHYTLILNGDESTFEKIETPFPNASSINHCLTIDGGKTYFCTGRFTNDNGLDERGLFIYNCETDGITPILTDSETGHVVSFVAVG